MKRIVKYSLAILILLFVAVIANGTYWLLSDIQMDCYNKVYHEKQDLNLYEKCSVYSLHVGICCVGWILSPEATREEILCLFPTSGITEMHSKALGKSKTIRAFMDKHPNATKTHPTWLSWNPAVSVFGHKTAYIVDWKTIQDLRCALAVNGSCLYREKGVWKITFKNNEFKYPHIPDYTCVGPFKFHEALFRYLQEIGWMNTPKIIWILKDET